MIKQLFRFVPVDENDVQLENELDIVLYHDMTSDRYLIQTKSVSGAVWSHRACTNFSYAVQLVSEHVDDKLNYRVEGSSN